MAGALIGALRVSLSAETSAFEAGMKRSQRTAKTTANSIAGSFKQAGGAMNVLKAGVSGFIASLSVGTIIAAGKAALDYAASLGETAQQLGVTTRELQNFRAAAAQNGASTEQADQALGKLSLSMSKAQSGSKEAAAAFSSVGVSLKDLNGSRWEVIGKIADGMIRQGGASKNAAAGVAIFGKGFQKIIPTLDQGSAGINDLADANERLGGVLSDEQIQNADKTADKIEQLYTVLKARIAADVAENSGAISEFASFLFQLADAATKARQALVDFNNNYSIPALVSKAKGDFFAQGYNTPGRAVSVKLPPSAAKPVVPVLPGAPPQFLAGGGGGRAKRDRSAEDALRKQIDALRDANQFDQEILQAKQDVLSAQQSLADNADDRANIDLELLNLDRRIFEGQLAYEVKLNEITKGADGKSAEQAKQLLELYGITESLKREAILQDQAQENLRAVARLKDVNFDLERDRLQSEEQLAETASEQRAIQLRLLDLSYRQERARLQSIMAEEKIGSVAWEEARRRLANLNSTFGNDRQSVINNTMGPWEEFASRVPQDAAQMREALESVAVDGVGAITDGLLDAIEGTKSLGEAFRQVAQQIIRELLRIMIQQMIVKAIGAGMGGFSAGGLVGGGSGAGLSFATDPSSVLFGGGFAAGGFVSGAGGPTADKIPALLSNGEFVINSGAVGKFGTPFFNAINTGQLTPEMLSGSAGGGGGGGGKGFLGKAAGMGMFGIAGLLASGKTPPIFGLAGKLFGFSQGGPVGLHIPRMAYGSRMGISNDNQGMSGGGMTINAPITIHGNATRETTLQMESALRRSVARASRVNG